MSDDGDEYLVERLTTDAGTEDGALQFDENALPRSGPSSAWGDGQITPEMIQAADQEIKTKIPGFLRHNGPIGPARSDTRHLPDVASG